MVPRFRWQHHRQWVRRQKRTRALLWGWTWVAPEASREGTWGDADAVIPGSSWHVWRSGRRTSMVPVPGPMETVPTPTSTPHGETTPLKKNALEIKGRCRLFRGKWDNNAPNNLPFYQIKPLEKWASSGARNAYKVNQWCKGSRRAFELFAFEFYAPERLITAPRLFDGNATREFIKKMLNGFLWPTLRPLRDDWSAVASTGRIISISRTRFGRGCTLPDVIDRTRKPPGSYWIC